MKLLSQLRRLFRNSSVPDTAAAITKAPDLTIQDAFAQQIRLALQQEHPELVVEITHNHLQISRLSLEIDCLVGEQNRHPNAIVIGLEVRVFHKRFFPTGITDCLAGIGENETIAIAKGAENYVVGVLLTIIAALSASHTPELDFQDPIMALTWHPILGNLQVQGAWTPRADELAPTYFFHLFQPLLAELLTDSPFHWLKIYVSRMPDGKCISDCLFDNQPWPTGLEVLQQEAESWNTADHFAGQKQFLLLRQCPRT